MRSISPACSRFRPASTSRVMSACAASGRWRLCRFQLTARRTWVLTPSAVGEAAAKVKRVDYFVPALGKGAEMLEGSREEIIDKLIELVEAKGGLK